jgi:HK97 family phage major capsid protein
MAKSLQALREDRARLANEYQTLVKADKFTKEVEAQADDILAQIERIDAQIKAINTAVQFNSDDAVEHAARVESNERGRSIDENAHRVKQALAALGRAFALGPGALKPEEQSLLAADHPQNRARIVNVAEGTSATGGVLVPTIVMPTVLEFMKAFGGMRLVANVIATAGGYPISYPTVDYTNFEGELVAENVTASSTDIDTFGAVGIGAYKFSSKIVPVSMEILQDAVFSPETIVLRMIAMAIARGQNRYFTTGTGIGQPQGAVTGASLGYQAPTGNTTSLAYDFFQEMYHSLDPAYRQNASWMMHDTTWKTVKKLKDANGRPIFLPSLESAFQGGDTTGYRIEGKPITINQHMAAPAATAKTIMFGDFSRYLIRDVMDVLILRFTDSAYASKGQVGFLGWARADGKIVDAPNSVTSAIESIRYFQHSAT